MNDPYQILGVSRTASDDEIKKAYRNLSRKYHPDANINNPNKEAAEAKFKDVQQAYQQIMNMGKYNKDNNYRDFDGFYSTNRQSYTNEDSDDRYYRAAENYIRSGHYQEALNVLSSIPNKDGHWYYYSAVAHMGSGNQATALEHIQKAIAMEPQNPSYRQLYNQIQSSNMWYSNMGNTYGYGMPRDASGGYCTKICLANLLCNMCLGGGLCC